MNASAEPASSLSNQRGAGASARKFNSPKPDAQGRPANSRVVSIRSREVVIRCNSPRFTRREQARASCFPFPSRTSACQIARRMLCGECLLLDREKAAFDDSYERDSAIAHGPIERCSPHGLDFESRRGEESRY